MKFIKSKVTQLGSVSRDKNLKVSEDSESDDDVEQKLIKAKNMMAAPLGAEGKSLSEFNNLLKHSQNNLDNTAKKLEMINNPSVPDELPLDSELTFDVIGRDELEEAFDLVTYSEEF